MQAAPLVGRRGTDRGETPASARRVSIRQQGMTRVCSLGSEKHTKELREASWCSEHQLRGQGCRYAVKEDLPHARPARGQPQHPLHRSTAAAISRRSWSSWNLPSILRCLPCLVSLSQPARDSLLTGGEHPLSCLPRPQPQPSAAESRIRGKARSKWPSRPQN